MKLSFTCGPDSGFFRRDGCLQGEADFLDGTSPYSEHVYMHMCHSPSKLINSIDISIAREDIDIPMAYSSLEITTFIVTIVVMAFNIAFVIHLYIEGAHSSLAPKIDPRKLLVSITQLHADSVYNLQHRMVT